MHHLLYDIGELVDVLGVTGSSWRQISICRVITGGAEMKRQMVDEAGQHRFSASLASMRLCLSWPLRLTTFLDPPLRVVDRAQAQRPRDKSLTMVIWLRSQVSSITSLAGCCRLPVAADAASPDAVRVAVGEKFEAGRRSA